MCLRTLSSTGELRGLSCQNFVFDVALQVLPSQEGTGAIRQTPWADAFLQVQQKPASNSGGGICTRQISLSTDMHQPSPTTWRQRTERLKLVSSVACILPLSSDADHFAAGSILKDILSRNSKQVPPTLSSSRSLRWCTASRRAMLM